MWWRGRDERPSLAFSVGAICTALIAFCELLALQARTVDDYVAALRAAHILVTLLMGSLVAFTMLYLHTGRLALAACGLGLRVLSTPFNFLSGQTLDFRHIESLRTLELLGDSVTVAVGVPNPWMLLSELGTLLVIAFLVDATVTVWQRGQRNVAFWAGASVMLFVLADPGQAILRYWGAVEAPVMLSPFFLGVIGVMAYATSGDLVNAKQQVAELRESQRQVASAAAAANLGTFTRHLPHDEIVASDEWRELFGFSPSRATQPRPSAAAARSQ